MAYLLPGQLTKSVIILSPGRTSITYRYLHPYFATALLSIPIKLFTHNIVLIHNLHLLLGSLAVFLSIWILANFLFHSKLAALLTALTFTFSAMHLQYLIHLHTFLIAGIPLTIYFYLQYLQKNKMRFLILTVLTFLYQILNAPMTGFFLGFILLLLLFNQEIRQKTKDQLGKVMVMMFIISLISFVFYLPYFQSATANQSARSIRDAAHFSSSLEQLLTPELILSLVMLLILSHQRGQQKHHFFLTELPLWVTIIFGLVMMLGPVLKIDHQTFKVFNLPIPLPYAGFYYLLPGFKAFRATSRFVVLVNFGLSLLLGMKLAQSALSNKAKIFFIVSWGTFLFLSQKDKYPLWAIEMQMPAIYQSVQDTETKMIELPAYTWDIQPLVSQESIRLLYQSQHHLTLYNGTSGFVPPEREKDFYWLTTTFPDQSTLNYLTNLDVKLVMIHFSQYDELKNNYPGFNQLNSSEQLKQQILKQPQLNTISCQQNDCLYLIQP